MRRHMQGRSLRRNDNYESADQRHLSPREYAGILSAFLASVAALECIEETGGSEQSWNKGIGVVIDQGGLYPTLVPLRAWAAPNSHAERLMAISRGADEGLYRLSTDLVRMFPAPGGSVSYAQARERVERFCDERHAEVSAIILRA